jgi:hypothetical protein
MRHKYATSDMIRSGISKIILRYFQTLGNLLLGFHLKI